MKRETVDRAIDRARFALDSFPGLDYQPLPWLGKQTAKRGAGAASRWQRMEPLTRELEVATAVDIGCNVGYFSLHLGKAGVATLGVEHYPKYYRPFLYAVDKLGLDDVGALVLKVNSRTVSLLPSADCVLFLSVWHHMVRHDGLEAASSVLNQVWAKTNRVLFFETGENELGPEWALPPLLPSPREFLTEYLQEQCDGSTVLHLGEHDAFAPDGTFCRRSLFALTKVS